MQVELGEVVARAGEGTIYEVVDRPEWVAKVFHPTLTDLPTKLAKVEAMAASPPPGAVQPDDFVVLTWPLHALELDDGTAGYLMRRVDTAKSVEIHAMSNPSNRANPLPSAPQWTKNASWEHLVNVAANLCLAVGTAHRVNAVIGDFQERNILVSDTTRVTLVGCDSMQFTDAEGHQYLCGVGRPEFTTPELARVNMRTHAREQPSDLFALAVHSSAGFQSPSSTTPSGQSARRGGLVLLGVLAAVALVGTIIVAIANLGSSSSSTSSSSNSSWTFTPPPSSAAVSLPAGAIECSAIPSLQPYTTAARGNDVTTCPFADNVRANVNNPSVQLPATISAYSPATQRWYFMDCTAGPLVTCTGGDNAVVYVY